jgi:inosose dehydratase
VGLCLDTGHLAYAGDDPVDAFRQYASRVNLCHLKDIARASYSFLKKLLKD